MQAIILDTETHTLNGQPIEIAYAPIDVQNGKLTLDKSKLFDQLYSVDEPISFAHSARHQQASNSASHVGNQRVPSTGCK